MVDHLAHSLAARFISAELRTINVRTPRFAALDHALAGQAIHDGHDRGVGAGQFGGEPVADIAHGGFLQAPQSIHTVELKGRQIKQRTAGFDGGCLEAFAVLRARNARGIWSHCFLTACSFVIGSSVTGSFVFGVSKSVAGPRPEAAFRALPPFWPASALAPFELAAGAPDVVEVASTAARLAAGRSSRNLSIRSSVRRSAGLRSVHSSLDEPSRVLRIAPILESRSSRKCSAIASGKRGTQGEPNSSSP